MSLEQPYLVALGEPYVVALERPYVVSLGELYIVALERSYVLALEELYIVALEEPFIVALKRPYVVAHAPVSFLTLKEFFKSTKLSLCLASHQHGRRIDEEEPDDSGWRPAPPSRSSRLNSGREPLGTCFESEAGWDQYPVWAICRREKSFTPTGRKARSTVAIPTELHRLQDAVCNVTHADSPTILVFRFRTSKIYNVVCLFLSSKTYCVCRDSSVGIATRYGLDGPGIESRRKRDIPHTSRPALGPTQLPVQWVPGFSGGKAAGPWR